MSDKDFTQTTSILDSAVVPWVLVVAMLTTAFLAACWIILSG
jgi:hypothetical protein